MRKITGICLTLTLAASLTAGCGIFQDPTPNNVSVRLSGSTPVEIVYSKQFVTGLDENGVTRVQIFASDTVYQSLPLDTVVSIEAERQFFVQVKPMTEGSFSVTARVDIDDRSVVNKTADLLQSDPFRYVYQFNQKITRIVDVVF